MPQDKTKAQIKYERLGDKGVLTETFPDGSWRSICRPVNDWLRIASRIQDANREPKVVSMKRPGGCGVKERIESTLFPDHDLTITSHGFGIDINQEGRIVHIDCSQWLRIVEIIQDQSSKAVEAWKEQEGGRG